MKAHPAPIVSGKYFLPKAPLLCLKRMPAWELTSVNSIGPDGRGGVGLALGEGDAAIATSVCGATAGPSAFLQDVRIENEPMINRAKVIRIREGDTPDFLLRANSASYASLR